MTYQQAVKHFRSLFAADPKDKPAARGAWVLFVDSLHRDKLITDHQAQTWNNPF